MSIEPARLECPETKDEIHLLPLPLFVSIAEFDSVDQYVGNGISVRTEMLCDGKTRRILVDASILVDAYGNEQCNADESP